MEMILKSINLGAKLTEWGANQIKKLLGQVARQFGNHLFSL